MLGNRTGQSKFTSRLNSSIAVQKTPRQCFIGLGEFEFIRWMTGQCEWTSRLVNSKAFQFQYFRSMIWGWMHFGTDQFKCSRSRTENLYALHDEQVWKHVTPNESDFIYIRTVSMHFMNSLFNCNRGLSRWNTFQGWSKWMCDMYSFINLNCASRMLGVRTYRDFSVWIHFVTCQLQRKLCLIMDWA